MKLTSITVLLARTINLGNYENMRIEGGATAMLEDGDNVEEAKADIVREARTILNAAYVELKPKAGPK